MAQQIETIRARITSLLCGAPFRFSPVPNVEDFDAVPIEARDRSFAIAIDPQGVEGASAYTETRVDHVVVRWARTQQGSPETCYTTLLTDVSSISSAVIRDGATGGGDFNVRDAGRGFTLDHTPGALYSTVALTLPVDYDAVL